MVLAAWSPSLQAGAALVPGGDSCSARKEMGSLAWTREDRYFQYFETLTESK